jgi:DNA polymerase-1
LHRVVVAVDALAFSIDVHEEPLLAAPEGDAPAVAEALRQGMEGVWKLAVPLVVDVGIGASWADAK